MIAVTQTILNVIPQKSQMLCEGKDKFCSHDVMFLTANVNYTHIYLRCGKVIVSTKTLKKFEQPLSQIGFWRVHKSVIINPAFMDTYTSSSEILMSNGLIVKVARRRKKNVSMLQK